jgi:hypothetical protein
MYISYLHDRTGQETRQDRTAAKRQERAAGDRGAVTPTPARRQPAAPARRQIVSKRAAPARRQTASQPVDREARRKRRRQQTVS